MTLKGQIALRDVGRASFGARPEIKGFSEFFAISGWDTHFKSIETTENRLKELVYEIFSIKRRFRQFN